MRTNDLHPGLKCYLHRIPRIRRLKILSSRLVAGLSVFLFGSTMIACSAGFFTYNGLVVDEDNLIRLENGGPHDGTLQTNDLTLTYRYTRKENNLMISGEIHFSDRVQYNYRQLDKFYLWIHLIDSENKIAGYENLYTHGHYLRIDDISLAQKTVQLPSDIKAFSFSYSGRVIEGGCCDKNFGAGTSLDFWRTPNG